MEGDANSSSGLPRIGYVSADCTVDHNVASGCQFGFQLTGGAGSVVKNNLAVGNIAVAGSSPFQESGFVVDGSVEEFQHNGAIGNAYAGLWIQPGGEQRGVW